MSTLSKRKKYVREMKWDWWKKNTFYQFYIARETTALFSLWFSLELLYGTLCLRQSGFDFLMGYAEFTHFLQNPIVVILNILTLGASMLNTVTYFNMTPKVTNFIVKSEKLNPNIITGLLWATTAVVTFFAIFLLF